MKKINWQKVQRKMDQRRKAGSSQWERINNDPDFIKAKREIQVRYGLPVPYDIHVHNSEWNKWMGYDEKPTSQMAKRGQDFLSDLNVLFKKFEVPDDWYDDFIAEIAGRSWGHADDLWTGPKFEHYKDREGNWKWRCIITPETDLTNPLYLKMIQDQQKKHAGDPPKPIKDKMNSRKLDWRPVYEWYKRHPLFTIEEIAKKIGYPAQRVRLKLAELESDK